MKAHKVAISLGMLISGVISLWIQYQVLKRINTSDIMWFLFWIHVPLFITMAAVLRLYVEEDTRQKTIDGVNKAIREHGVDKFIEELKGRR